MMSDSVNHPIHYKSGDMETIDVIKNFTSDVKGFQAVCMGNVIKYITRWNKKNGLEDLLKARTYLNWLIKDVEDNGMDAGDDCESEDETIHRIFYQV
jgi:hypothetical protein